MITPTMFVLVIAIFLGYRVLMFALRRKGSARGSVGKTTFCSEVDDRTYENGRKSKRAFGQRS